MARTVEAVYENGVFRPLVPVQCEEGQRVQVYVPSERRDITPEQVLQEMRDIQAAFADWTDEDWAEFEKTFKRGE